MNNEKKSLPIALVILLLFGAILLLASFGSSLSRPMTGGGGPAITTPEDDTPATPPAEDPDPCSHLNTVEKVFETHFECHMTITACADCGYEIDSHAQATIASHSFPSSLEDAPICSVCDYTCNGGGNWNRCEADGMSTHTFSVIDCAGCGRDHLNDYTEEHDDIYNCTKCGYVYAGG